MGNANSSGQGEAPSARHSVTNKPNGAKNHNPNTGKSHTYAVPGCDLTKVVIKCSHVKAEKKEEKPASGPASPAHAAPAHPAPAHAAPAPPAAAHAAPAAHPAPAHPAESKAESKEEGSRIITLPEEGAAEKPEPTHAVPAHAAPAPAAPTHAAPAPPAAAHATPAAHPAPAHAEPAHAETPRKVVMGVVPSGRKTTEKTPHSFLNGAVKIEAEHSYGASSFGDKVNFTATVRGKCSKHPLWTISDGGKQVAAVNKDILDYEFLPPAPDKNKLESVFQAWWLKDVKPRVYEVTCKTCKGAEKIGPVTINVYPAMESKVSVDFGAEEKEEKGLPAKAHTLEQVVAEFVKALHVIEEEFGQDPAKFVEWPRGKIALSNKWEEDEKSPQAYWGGALEIGLDPLIGMKVHVSVPIVKALKFVPKFVRKYVDVDVYLEVSGGLKLKTALEWSLKTDHGIQVTGDVKDTLGGDIGLEVGAEAIVRKRDYTVVSVVMKGNTAVGADGSLKFTDEGEVELEGKLSWKGLDVAASVKFLNGKLEKDVEAEVMKGGESNPARMLLVKKDAAATP